MVDPPAALINEVTFDPFGVDGSAIGAEWVELYFPADTDLTGWTLRSNTGALLANLPAATAPAYSVLVVVLGNTIPFHLDGNFSDARAAFAAGLPLGDHLGNDAGGVRLVAPGGAIADSVYWGTGAAPAGATGGSWPTGTYFDIAYGAHPIAEGDSIGRPADPLTTYTGTVADWDRNGGRNAAGPTAGGRNGVHPVDLETLILHSQTGVNQVLAGYGQTEKPEWIEIIDAHAIDVSGSYSSTGCQVSATHVFVLRMHTKVVMISGKLISTLVKNETPGAVSYTLTTTGSLDSVPYIGGSPDGQHVLELDHSETYSGFQTDTITCASTTESTYYEAGDAYPVSVDVVYTQTRTGQHTWLAVDQRTACDYGGAGPKSSLAGKIMTRVQDGIYQTQFGVDRNFPIAPPLLSQAGTQTVYGNEQLFIDTISDNNDAGEVDGAITRLDVYWNGSSLSSWLEPGSYGQFGSTYVDGGPGTLPQHVESTLSVPMMLGGQPTSVDATIVETTYVAGDKLISEAYSSAYFGNVEVMSGAYYMDPPIQGTGCVHCAKCRAGIIHIHLGCDVCPPPPPAPPQDPAPAPPPPPKPPKTVIGFFGQVGACATAGGIILTIIPVAGTAAGAISGGIHCGILYLFGVH